MKWFKHISDSLDDPFIFDLIDEFGDFGYVAFFGILEIYSREFKPENSEELRVKVDYIRQKLRQKRAKKLKNFLEYMSRSRKWRVTFEGMEVIIFIPKFNDLADEWTRKKLRSDSGLTPPNLRHEVEVDKDKDKDKETTKEKYIKRKVFGIPSLKQITDYCNERNNNVNPEQFLSFYESKNWMIGKNKMKDWKAAVRTWEQNSQQRANATDPTEQTKQNAEAWLNQGSDNEDMGKIFSMYSEMED